MITKNKKILFIIAGIILLAALIFLVVSSIKSANYKKRTVEVTGLSQEVKDIVKKNNPGPTLEITSEGISPKSFLVEYPGNISLAIISNLQAHDLVFSNATTSLDKIHLEPSEIKKINLKLPEPGVYTLNCLIPGHKEKGEIGEMIVNAKVSDPDEESRNQAYFNYEKVRIPGASMVINNGLIEPNILTVAKDSSVLLSLSASDNQDHNIIFSDSTIWSGEIKVTSGQSQPVTLKTTKVGEYEFHCTIPGHEKESGKMIVK